MTTTLLPNASGIHIEVWDRRFFLRVNNFTYSKKNYRAARRPAISLVIALNNPFTVTLSKDSAPVKCQSILVGPEVLRDQFDAHDADLWVFDVAINTQEYRDLASIIAVDEIRMLDPHLYERVAALCRAHDRNTSARTLLDAVIYTLCERHQAKPLDARISQVLALVDTTPAEDITVSGLATAVGLSESRLRALFNKQMNINLSRYIRFTGFWKAIMLIVQGNNFTDAAHGAGFHDLPHFHRVATEFSGFSPTAGLTLFGTLELHRQWKIFER